MIPELETMANSIRPYINENDSEAVAALYALDKHIDGLEHALAQQGAAYERVCKQADKYEHELMALKASLFDAGMCKPQAFDDMDF